MLTHLDEGGHTLAWGEPVRDQQQVTRILPSRARTVLATTPTQCTYHEYPTCTTRIDTHKQAFEASWIRVHGVHAGKDKQLLPTMLFNLMQAHGVSLYVTRSKIEEAVELAFDRLQVGNDEQVPIYIPIEQTVTAGGQRSYPLREGEAKVPRLLSGPSFGGLRNGTGENRYDVVFSFASKEMHELCTPKNRSFDIRGGAGGQDAQTEMIIGALERTFEEATGAIRNKDFVIERTVYLHNNNLGYKEGTDKIGWQWTREIQLSCYSNPETSAKLWTFLREGIANKMANITAPHWVTATNLLNEPDNYCHLSLGKTTIVEIYNAYGHSDKKGKASNGGFTLTKTPNQVTHGFGTYVVVQLDTEGPNANWEAYRESILKHKLLEDKDLEVEFALLLQPGVRFGTSAKSLPYLAGYPTNGILFGCVGTFPPNTSSIDIDLATVSTTQVGKKRLKIRLLRGNPLFGERDAWHLNWFNNNTRNKGTMQLNHTNNELEAVQMQDGTKLSEMSERWLAALHRGQADKRYTYPMLTIGMGQPSSNHNTTSHTQIRTYTPNNALYRTYEQHRSERQARMTSTEENLVHENDHNSMITEDKTEITTGVSVKEMVEQMITNKVREELAPIRAENERLHQERQEISERRHLDLQQENERLHQELLTVKTSQVNTEATVSANSAQITAFMTMQQDRDAKTEAQQQVQQQQQQQLQQQQQQQQTNIMAMLQSLVHNQQNPTPQNRLQDYKTDAREKDDV